jgi:hypothetical protein
MPKYSVGFTYTVWVDCEAATEEEAVVRAIDEPYNYVDVHNTNARMELNEFDDPIVVENDED